MDFRGLPFGPVPTLLAIAEIVDKLQAICVVCGGPASRNQRLVNGKPAVWNSPTIMVGGRESYEARCRQDRKSTRLNSSHLVISYAVFCLKKKKTAETETACTVSA